MPKELIPADLRPWLKRLRLQQRRARAGSGFGLHQSHSRGAGLEFAQYRAYEPGDEPRQIDWKLYARSDRFFVREAERDSALTVWVLIDCSASMGQADSAAPDYRRLDAACTVAACVFEVALRQGDRFGLIALRSEGIELIPAATGPRQRDRCLHSLLRLQPEGAAIMADKLRSVWERIGNDALSLMLSDGLDPAPVELAQRLAAAGRELVFVRLLNASERDFDFPGGTRFIDPETGSELRADAPAIRTGFLERFGTQRRQLLDRLSAAGIRAHEHVLDQPLGPLLQAMLA